MDNQAKGGYKTLSSIYRAFGGQNKIMYSTRFVTRRAIISLLPGNNIIIAWALCDQSLNIDLRLRLAYIPADFWVASMMSSLRSCWHRPSAVLSWRLCCMFFIWNGRLHVGHTSSLRLLIHELMTISNTRRINTDDYYPYRAFGGQN